MSGDGHDRARLRIDTQARLGVCEVTLRAIDPNGVTVQEIAFNISPEKLDLMVVQLRNVVNDARLQMPVSPLIVTKNE